MSWLNKDREESVLTLSSFRSLHLDEDTLTARGQATYRESMRASSPSNPMTACGVFASMTFVKNTQISAEEVYANNVRQAHIVVIAMRTILVALFVRCHILAESLFALLAHKRHLRRSCELVSLRLSMALGTVKPLLATWCADGDLGIQNVLAVWTQVSIHVY